MIKNVNIYNIVKLLIIVSGTLSFSYGSEPIPNNDTFLFCLRSTINPIEINRSSNGVFVENELAAKRRKEQEDLNRECKMAILPENFKDYESARILFIMNNIDRLTKKQKKNLLKCRRQLKTANKSRKPILTRCKSM